MLRRSLLFIVLFAFFVLLRAQNMLSGSDLSQNNNIISKFKHLSQQQLLDTAYYHYDKNNADTALVCYSLLINAPAAKQNDSIQQKRVVEALNYSAILYCSMCDYRTAFELLIKALLLCEKHSLEADKSDIYNNIGNIYYGFKKYDMAKPYHQRALELCHDSSNMVLILNNLGIIEMDRQNADSAFYYLNKSLNLSRMNNNAHIYIMLHNLAMFYQNVQSYDSAFYYCRLALDEAKINKKIENEAATLSVLGSLYFDANEPDSALRYISLSNHIAEKSNFLKTAADNYLILSKIEEAAGNTIRAFEHYKTYANLQDSIFNVDQFGDISQLQRVYEISKTNQQIERLAIEQQIKDRTIRYQNIIQFITMGVLLLVSAVLLFVFYQKRKLNTAYKVLFQKNIEIIALQENIPEGYSEKYRKNILSDEMQQELLDKILLLMEDTSIICDPKFTIDKLAELVQSNRTYVSQVINTSLNKNFRSFLNDYRIREAQRLFSDLDATKYTIESVAFQVGFKSPSAFRTTFKEVTGVSPNFYFNSIHEQFIHS